MHVLFEFVVARESSVMVDDEPDELGLLFPIEDLFM
jgi:hypothetical protein